MESPLYAHEIGEGLPVLIIHGWQMQGLAEEHDFEPIFSAIPGLRRIYVDLPGMGKTPANGVKNLDGIYDRLVQFIDSRLGDSRFLLIGSSCGGYLARAIAQKYIGQVDGLLLRVPLMEPVDSKRDVDRFNLYEPLVAEPGLMSSLPDEERGVLGNVLVQTRSYVDVLKKKYDDVYLPADKASDNEVLDPIREDPLRYALSKFSEIEHAKFFAPTLVLCGRHDESVGYRDSLRLLELYPRSTHIVMDRGRHGLPIDETGLFAALVRDWITRVEEWRNRDGL